MDLTVPAKQWKQSLGMYLDSFVILKKNRVLISAFVNYFIQQHMLHSALLPQNTTKHWSFTEWSYCLNSEEEGYSVTGVCCIAGVLSLTLRNGLANLGWGGSRGRRCVASMPDKSWTFHISITNTPEAFFFLRRLIGRCYCSVSHWETLTEREKTLISVEKSYVLQRVTDWVSTDFCGEKPSASTDSLCFRRSDFSNRTILLFWLFLHAADPSGCTAPKCSTKASGCVLPCLGESD